jgi:hypothetical protein
MDSIEAILYNYKNPFMQCVHNVALSKIRFNLERVKKQYGRDTFPSIIRMNNLNCGAERTYQTEIVIDEIGTYRLEALAMSSNYNRASNRSRLGHAMPVIRTYDGKYVKLDDLTGRVSEISEDAIESVFRTGKWKMAFYVRVDQS